MRIVLSTVLSATVALPAEGVDRNGQNRGGGDLPAVALPAEGVDRNIQTSAFFSKCRCRPPRGGRG